MRLLLASFGSDDAYVVGGILIMIAVLIVLAFRQGRTIEFWPPKIGSRPDRISVAVRAPSAQEDSSTSRQRPMSSQAAQVVDIARIYEVPDAAQFYQQIASSYDQRNSAKLLVTHMEVITRIDQARRTKPDLRVLDLGGGTGHNVATYFFNDPHIFWTYVDNCPAMINQLQRHLEGRRLYERLEVHMEDINRVYLRLKAGSYDVILLNLTLSSMPKLPDFTKIAKLLAPTGRLIVADINPSYTNSHPYYKAMAADGTQLALHTCPVQPLEVATRAKEARLRLAEMTEIGPGEISYSFITTFVNPVRPNDGYPAPKPPSSAASA